MVVMLSDDYRVQIDKFNHTLQKFRGEHVVKKKGELVKVPESWYNLSFHPTVAKAIIYAVNNYLGDSEDEVDFKGYVAELDKVHEAMTERAKG